MMAHLSSSSAIFSPSVARQQFAQAKDWNYIDSWLSTKFNGKAPPPFERNNDTLKALLALAALNESADEESELFSKVETKALLDLRAREEADHCLELNNTIQESLAPEGTTCLEALAAASVKFNQSETQVENVGSAVFDLQATVYDLDQTSERISILESHLGREMLEISNFLRTLQSDMFQTSPDLISQTTDYQRRTKTLVSKLPEMQDRVVTLSRSLGTSGITIQSAKSDEDKLKDVMAIVKTLETQVRGYHGLPQDRDLARLELEAFRVELRQLTRERDSMFEGLVERESPKRRK